MDEETIPDEDKITKIEDETVFAKEDPEVECDCKIKGKEVMAKIKYQDQFILLCTKCGEIWRREKVE
jgi:hypothetical protein